MQNVPKNTSLSVTHIGLSDFPIVGYTNLPNKNLFNEINDETKEVPYSELEKSILNNMNSLPNTLDYADDECDTPIIIETKEEFPPLLEPLFHNECYNGLKEVIPVTRKS